MSNAAPTLADFETLFGKRTLSDYASPPEPVVLREPAPVYGPMQDPNHWRCCRWSFVVNGLCSECQAERSMGGGF